MADKCYVVYQLNGVDSKGQLLQYTGNVEVFRWQTREQAAGVRLTYHISKKLHCLQDLVPTSARMEALSPRLKLDDALELEAVRTVVSFHSARNKAVSRGGPYCLKHLSRADQDELSALSEICELPSWSAKVERLRKLVSAWKHSSSMKRHLDDKCYRCGKLDWRNCGCRSARQNIQSSNTASLNSHTSSPHAHIARAMKAVVKSRSGTRYVPVALALRKRRIGRDPTKRRSGKTKSGAAKLNALGLTPNELPWKLFKYGKTPAQTVTDINKKHWKKRKHANVGSKLNTRKGFRSSR